MWFCSGPAYSRTRAKCSMYLRESRSCNVTITSYKDKGALRERSLPALRYFLYPTWQKGTEHQESPGEKAEGGKVGQTEPLAFRVAQAHCSRMKRVT